MTLLTAERIAEIDELSRELSAYLLAAMPDDSPANLTCAAACELVTALNELLSHIEGLKVTVAIDGETIKSLSDALVTISDIVGSEGYDDALARIRELSRIDDTGWQPIKTAPRLLNKGIDLWVPRIGRVPNCYWYVSRKKWGASFTSLLKNEPTHWRPTPLPPSKKEG